MEFKKISPDLRKRNDTEGDHLSEEKKYFENLEWVLFENDLINKEVLFNHEFPGQYSRIKKSIYYSNEKSMNGVLLQVDSILGNQKRRWDYNFYFTGNEKFKDNLKEGLNNFLLEFRGTALFPQGDRDPLKNQD